MTAKVTEGETGANSLDLPVCRFTAGAHSGKAPGRLPGAGSSPGRNQVGEVWAENWSLAKDRTYGITARLGARLPMFGADSLRVRRHPAPGRDLQDLVHGMPARRRVCSGRVRGRAGTA